MTLFVMQNLWYLVLCASVILYTVLDGFDLGVGILHLFGRTDRDRRIHLNAIGPVWDGNEVWLVVIGGALLSGFPDAYATIFSGFYTPMMVFLMGIIFRAVAIEFRSKKPSACWRQFWDVSFSVASIIIAFGIGLMLGCMVCGIPLDANREFVGSFKDFINSYTISVGFLSLALCALHGLIYLLLKTEDETHERLRALVKPCVYSFLVLYVLVTVLTFFKAHHMLDRMWDQPWLFAFPVIALACILNITHQVFKGRDGIAFISSSLSIIFLFSLFMIGTYPILVRSTVNTADYSITVFNSSSSELTLKVLMIVVLIGIPLVLAYGAWIYRIFRGKVKLDDTSY